ncbi:MAG TPA: hypothetical protein VGL72_29950 [Bryobacteraceae bacterium]|jgi:hypothetical protein
MVTRRTLLASFGAAALVRAGPATVALLDDPRFVRGLSVIKATPGVRIPAGDIVPRGSTGKPAWSGAQWYSRFNLAQAPRRLLPSGSSIFFDGAKSITFGARGTREADIIFAVNGHTEYGDRAPAAGQPWPHLLAECELSHHPTIAELRAVPFRIQYRLLKSQAFHLPGWNSQRHTAQFQFYLTVRNANRASKGYLDYLWFGVPMYDARTPLPRPFAAPDKGSALKVATGKFIFTPGGEPFSETPAQEGKWVPVDRDLLMLIREALNAAWAAGYLQDSRRLEDYQLGGVNIGWEVTGPLDVAMQIRGLSFEARTGA